MISYGDVIVVARCPREFLLWCSSMLASDAKLEDDGVWKVAFSLGRYIDGHYSLEDQDVM